MLVESVRGIVLLVRVAVDSSLGDDDFVCLLRVRVGGGVRVLEFVGSSDSEGDRLLVASSVTELDSDEEFILLLFDSDADIDILLDAESSSVADMERDLDAARVIDKVADADEECSDEEMSLESVSVAEKEGDIVCETDCCRLTVDESLDDADRNSLNVPRVNDNDVVRVCDSVGVGGGVLVRDIVASSEIVAVADIDIENEEVWVSDKLIDRSRVSEPNEIVSEFVRELDTSSDGDSLLDRVSVAMSLALPVDDHDGEASFVSVADCDIESVLVSSEENEKDRKSVV